MNLILQKKIFTAIACGAIVIIATAETTGNPRLEKPIRINQECPPQDLFGQKYAKEIDALAAKLPDRNLIFPHRIENRELWEGIKNLMGHDKVEECLRNAEKYSTAELRPISDFVQAYEDYQKPELRARTAAVFSYWRKSVRFYALCTLIMAECFENKGRFIPAIVRYVDVICQMPSWCKPDHDPKRLNFQKDQVRTFTLNSTHTALILSAAYSLLENKLPLNTRQQIKVQLNKYILDPYFIAVNQSLVNKNKLWIPPRENCWWLAHGNNWNLICSKAPVICAAIVLDDKRRQAWFYKAVEENIRFIFVEAHYRQVYSQDGYCRENLGYWGYAEFGILQQMLLMATSGNIDLAKFSIFKSMAYFPIFSQISQGVWSGFGDIDPNLNEISSTNAFFMHKIYHIEEYKEYPPAFSLYDGSLLIFPGAEIKKYIGKTVTNGLPVEKKVNHWFDRGQVLISRDYPDAARAFAGTFKGYNERGQHCHNDVGNFEVIFDGRKLIADFGYVKGYEYWNSSYHSLPLINDKIQRQSSHYILGEKLPSTITQCDLSNDKDIVAIDLRDAYSDPALKKISRTFEHDRKKREIVVTDRVELKTPSSFESRLTTYGTISIGKDGKSVFFEQEKRKVKVTIDAGHHPFELKILKTQVPMSTWIKLKPEQVAGRVGIKLTDNVTAATVIMRIIPVDSSDL